MLRRIPSEQIELAPAETVRAFHATEPSCILDSLKGGGWMSTVWNSPQAAEVPRVAEDAEGLVYYLHSGYGETDENHGVGPTGKKKWCWFHAKQEIRTKNRFCCVATLSGERI